MSYLDYGYSNYCTKPIAQSPLSYSSIQIDAMLESISGGKLTTGQIVSNDGKTTIDLINNRIILNDGTNDRILIGYLEDGF